MASNEELMNKIASLRDEREYGDKSVHPFSAPKLNWSATSIRNIKDWSDITEPLSTTSISTQELVQFPSHTQSCKRAVKEVSRESKHVLGADRRDGFIRAALKSRQVMSMMQKKTNFEALIPK